MFTLGYVLTWLICLAVLVALAAIPVTIAWHLWIKARQAYRAANRPRRSPYDDAMVRALESIAARNGERDAHRELEGL